MSTAENKSILNELSESLADAVERAGQSMVRVSARRRLGATGLIWRPDGLIVTADHVIERDEEITVGLPDGREVGAMLVGRDPGTDLAVLRVDAQGLTAVTPSTQTARVGHLVLALGRPRDGAPLATLGVVAAVGGSWRTWRGGSVEGAIRSDVTLYPGFSGGPLVDSEGHLLGLNSSRLGRGLAVTLPHAAVTRIVDALVAQGKVRRAYLGIATQPVALPAGLRTSLGLSQEAGLLVVGIEPDSPAERAGLLLGDILVAFAGQPVADLRALQERLSADTVGTTQTLRIIRGGQSADVSITVGER